jgi:hypothetical protein
MLLANTAHLRAEVLRFEMDRDAVWLHQRDQRVSDLNTQTLLHGEAAREQTHEPGQLRDADDLLVRDVRDMSETVERQRVVFTERIEGDRPPRPPG